MGVYSLDRHNMTDSTLFESIVTNESYDHVTGPSRILLESEKNDMAIFSAIICNDMSNITKLNEGVLLESELEELNEAAGAGFFETIAKALESLASKIKGIIESFITKVSVMLSHDAAKFATKYNAELEKADLSGFKYKGCKTDPSKAGINVNAVMEKFKNTVLQSFSGKSAEEIKTTLSGYEDNNSLLCTLLETSYPGIKVTDPATYDKSVMDAVFGEAKEYTGLTTEEIRLLTVALNISNPSLKIMKDKEAKDISELAAMANEFRKKSKDKNVEKDVQVLANAQYKVTAIGNTAIVRSYTTYMNIIKFEVQQTFSILKKAVIYMETKKNKPEAKTESVDLEDYAYDVAMDEVQMAIDL